MRPAGSWISAVELLQGKRAGVGGGGEILGKMAGDYEEPLPNGRMRQGKVAPEEGHESGDGAGGLKELGGAA